MYFCNISATINVRAIVMVLENVAAPDLLKIMFFGK